ncbi:MAG: DUF1499 domain-containing protein [Cyanobacterium sp. T60_A2020_053]|nr:DUF1499 domain-containing protein [Cyanobacterium sp. T60_A2020_053]
MIISFISFLSALLLFFTPFASIFHIEGQPPQNLGVQNQHLAPCPKTPNCVITDSGDTEHYIEPIAYDGAMEEVRGALLKVLTVVPNTEIVAEKDNYIRIKSTSKIMGFADDTEFYFPEGQKIIKMRASARLGESDLGVNRRRLEQIRLALTDFLS